MQGEHGKKRKVLDPGQVKRLDLLSKLATFTCVLMYVSYIPEIMANFSGTPVNPIQPLVAMINATLWTGYGWLKPVKDWPIIIANFPGILFGLITFVTVFVH
ncbi:hypothetical protein BVJ53_13000 [Lacticaseibacillus chiayiensis]|uniref:SWEET family sugar transporter n=1 Tax=Lacticaseibacillus chiayiensis TaxID=2100821 RepID=A0A4Q1TM15_9LACO|nr:SemiSWEET family transporter [Lacticaseibacillus chiayiensis]QVI35296.1 hypothetical protein KG086_02860 [Lacticaseibacillus chiayiensis]RXT18908.1 hypothetical protein BVJ53_13000 [Lacticaseibacillus chiayiensis]RXT54420.1 hypothetical protein CHT97_13215 [Lacticaseibacillus chiayiensis]UYN57077.1 SWEET family sugar transporter [Lacticaseibacillus chiayiensis]